MRAMAAGQGGHTYACILKIFSALAFDPAFRSAAAAGCVDASPVVETVTSRSLSRGLGTLQARISSQSRDHTQALTLPLYACVHLLHKLCLRDCVQNVQGMNQRQF